MRLFVAIELPHVVRQHLAACQRDLEEQLAQGGAAHLVRWTPQANLHLTLRFLGETSVVQQTALAQTLAALAPHHPALELALGRLGCFPNFRRPNIVWIDLGGALAALQQLQAAIEGAAQAAGFLPEERPFTPHLTIGRVRRDANPAALQQAGTILRGQAAAGTGKPARPFSVNEFVLMESELKPAGPIYSPLGVYTVGLVKQ